MELTAFNRNLDEFNIVIYSFKAFVNTLAFTIAILSIMIGRGAEERFKRAAWFCFIIT